MFGQMSSTLRLLFLILVVVGCTKVQKDYKFMSEEDYQKRPQLLQSMTKDSAPLSEEAIQKILSSKVVLPKSINLAIVRLTSSTYTTRLQEIDQEIAEKFYDKTNWGTRVQTTIPMPEIMIAQPITLTTLRQAAVLLQADALLIVNPIYEGNYKASGWFEKDKAKATTSLQVLLLDTRTSVVLFTQVIAETAEVVKTNDSDSNYELMSQARKISEAKAILQVAPSIKKFILETAK